MSQTPRRPTQMPEQPSLRASSRYNRPRRYISWLGLLIGLALGVSGGLYYAWVVSPVVETDTRPAQLRDDAQDAYIVAVALAFSYDSDLGAAISRLSALEADDPVGIVAQTACELAQEGYINNSSGLRALRRMQTFYQLQERTSCADDIIPPMDDEPQVVQVEVPTPTPTLPPPPTKSPLESETVATQSGVIVVPTSPPQRNYDGAITGTFCRSTGIIEVRVIDSNGQPLPGQAVRVRWSDGEDRFVTGIKPERGADYADFTMESGRSYIIDMPGQSDPISGTITADSCTLEGGATGVTSYRVTFRRSN